MDPVSLLNWHTSYVESLALYITKITVNNEITDVEFLSNLFNGETLSNGWLPSRRSTKPPLGIYLASLSQYASSILYFLG